MTANNFFEAKMKDGTSEKTEVLIIGPGKMGAGLAQALAQNGVAVGLVGRTRASVSKGFDLIDKSLEEGVSKGVFTAEESIQIRERIKGLILEDTFQETATVRMVIEAISEDMEAKSNLFKMVDFFLPPPTVLATITSSLDAEALAARIVHPERVVWTHFFYPPQKNKTVELAFFPYTTESTKGVCYEILTRARRLVFPLLRYRRGGVVNIILTSLILEAIRLVDEGFDVLLVDKASQLALSMPMGLISLLQLIGPATALATAVSFSRATSSSDSLFSAFDNFFSLPSRLQELFEEQSQQALGSFLQEKDKASSRERSFDPLVVELARQRFQAVAFMAAAEVVGAGLIDQATCDRLCQSALNWPQGPFWLMNQLGIEASLRLVTERMELSHRQEINFPVPRILIEQAQRKERWLLSEK